MRDGAERAYDEDGACLSARDDGALPADGQSVQADDEPLTEELLERLLASSSPEAYLVEEPTYDRTLADYLGLLLREKGLMRSEVLRASGLNASYGYQLFQGVRIPGRDHALMLALGLGCTLRETQRLLRLAGHDELWCKRRRDAILIFCIEHGYSRVQTDDELWRLGEATLLSVEE